MVKSHAKVILFMIVVALLNACSPATTPAPPTTTATPAPPSATPPTVAPTPADTDSQFINLETAAQLGQVIVFEQPASFVHTVTFSPDNRYLITTDQNGDVVIREVGTWKEQAHFTTQPDVSSASLSPDGTMIVTGGAAGNIMTWDLAGNALFSTPYSGTVFCTQFSPDGRYLAVGGENDQVMIVDIAAQQKAADLVSDHHYVSNLVFSQDSKTLLVGYERPENAIKIWDTSTWEESTTFSHVTERIDYHDLVFSPDGRYLIVASTQNAIKFLDVATWHVVKELEGHTRGTYQVVFSADGALLISACDDGSLRLWDVETGDSVKTIRGYRENVAIDLSPDGAWIAFSGWGEGVQVWTVSPAATGASPTPTPALQAAANVPITPTNAANVQLLRTIEGYQGKVWTVAFSGDGVYLATADRDSINVWELASGQEAFALGIRELDLNSFVFSPDSRLLATAHTIWDVESWQVLHTLDDRHYFHAAFSPDGVWLAVSGGQPIKLWNVASRQVRRTFEAQADNHSFNIVFSPDGTLLADSGHDGRIRLWDVASGQVARTLTHSSNTPNDIHDIAFSPDGKWLVSVGTDYTVRLWDVTSGEQEHTMGHRDGLYGVAFSPDSSLVASASCDRTVKLWDVTSGRMVRSLSHGDEVTSVAFSPDGTLLASGAYDSKVYLWGIP